MDGLGTTDHVENINKEEHQSSSTPPEPMSDPIEPTQPTNEEKLTSQHLSARHRRGVSVDMLAYEGGDARKLENDQPLEDGPDMAPNSAYLTPQSGISSNGSTAVAPQRSGAGLASKSQSDRAPEIDEQISQVMNLVTQPMREGQKGYIVATKWLSQVLSRGSDARSADKYAKQAREGDIGPVDNTGMNLITDPSSGEFKDEAGEPFIPLRPGLQLSEDFEIVPQEAWDLIIKWYGLAEGSPVFTRYSHNTSTSETTENVQFELHPPIFTILKLPDPSKGTTTQTLREKDAVPVKVVASRHELFQKFLKRAKTAAGIELRTRVRMWKIQGGLRGNSQAGLITPAQSRSASPSPNVVAPVDPGNRLVLDVHAFAALQDGSQRELLDAKDETMNENYNGHISLDFVGLSRDEVVVLEEQIGGPAGGEWVSDAASKTAAKNGVPVSISKNGSTTVQGGLKPKGNTASGRTSPAPGAVMTRGRTQKNGRTRGTVGLSNLGNTCYMNSALQCVRSVEELTQYFLQGNYRKELNPRNPLAHNGDVARVYASLLGEIYSETANSSFSPRQFKQTVGKYGPSFSGYGQQDSQEFLLFLLDGLQEDLNRVHKKPYIEKPDSTDEMVNDPIALRGMADKCWDIYKARNDSVITDLFAGMYKSTVVCPVCDKVSIIFDPFNNLTLQLPIENVWTRTLYFFPLYSRPIRVAVDIDKNASFSALKEYVAKKVGVEAKKTVIAEIYKHRFFKMFDDHASLSDERIAEGDSIGIFELEDLPTNYPPPKKKGQKVRSMLYTGYGNSDEEEDVPEGDSPLAEKMLVGVFNRVVKDGSSRFQQKALFGVPSYIIVTREEAKDYDAILRKVLAKAATMTTTDILNDEDASDTESIRQEESDTVLMTADDADSASDSKVQASSVEGEDGIVDISMRDAGDEPQQTPRRSYPPPQRRKRTLPRMLRPGEFITPEVRNLFDIKYFSGTEMIPTGWTALQDENKSYPSIASRIPEPARQRKQNPKTQLARRIANGGSTTSSDEDDDNASPEVNSSSALNADDSDSEGLPVVRNPANSVSGGFSRSNRRTPRNTTGLITYSRKGKRSIVASSREDIETEPQGASGPLLHLGEAIVLDWNPQAYDALFFGSETSPDNDMRGAPTWEEIPMLPDPELEKRRQLRSSRKRNGVSLGDCLDEFGKAEILSENDAWYCPRCKEHRRASKKFELWKAPDILVIHLKRFSAQGRLRDKLDVFVDFPVEGLDLSSRVAIQEEGKSPIYDLFAVDNHYGGLGGGHYTAFARNFFDQNWYEYNDSQASRRQNPQAVVTSAAYLLFYRRRSDHPLGGSFFEKIVQLANNSPSTTLSQPPSRNESPSAAGEGKRLGDSSRNGSSSAFQGVGAAHQAGDGGLAAGMTGVTTEVRDDVLPGYSDVLPPGEKMLDSSQPRTLESMDMDETDDYERIDTVQQQRQYHIQDAHEPTWQGFGQLTPLENYASSEEGFRHLPIVTRAPPGSDGEMDEDLFDGASTKALSSVGASEDGDSKLMTDFAEQGMVHGEFELMGRDDEDEGQTFEDLPPLLVGGGRGSEEEVAEVRLSEEGLLKMD